MRPIIKLSPGLAFLLCATAGSADPVFNVSMNTAALVGDPAAPFFLEFQFNDGSGTNDGNNTVVMDQFALGAGGGAVGLPSTIGGVTGDLSSSVTLTDSDFFNQFIQEFTPGDLLSFRLKLPTNVDAGGVPDEFSFSILDSGFTEIPTLGFFDVFLLADIDSNHPVPSGFASDSSRNTAAGGAPVDLDAPLIREVTEVPEPAGAGLAALSLLAAGLIMRIRK